MAWALVQSTLVNPVEVLFRHRTLTLALAKREILDRYVGQMLGTLWVLGHPLLLVSVYVFVFQYVCQMRLGGTADLPLDYTVYILSGLIPWLAFAELLAKAPLVMHANVNLVKQVVFPLEVLPVKTVMVCFVTQALCTFLLVSYTVISSGSLPWTYCLLPLLWFAQFLAMAGTCFALSAIGAYFRDLREIVHMFTMVGIYLMPIAYLPEWVPALVRPLLYLNPFSYMAWCFQDVCYFGRFEHPWAWVVFLGLAVIVFALGYRLFARLKVYFGSIL
jgi:lipopolysaccharide transport system permease protein